MHRKKQKSFRHDCTWILPTHGSGFSISWDLHSINGSKYILHCWPLSVRADSVYADFVGVYCISSAEGEYSTGCWETVSCSKLYPIIKKLHPTRPSVRFLFDQHSTTGMQWISPPTFPDCFRSPNPTRERWMQAETNMSPQPIANRGFV